MLPIAVAIAICSVPAWMLLGRASSQPLPAWALPLMTDTLAAFPPVDPALPISTPLAPLLAADAPESLAVISPAGEGAVRVRRGESYEVRFNRPMVRGVDVGRALASSPLVLTPRVPGSARWISRSTLAFTPDAHAFDRARQSRVAFVDGLASIDGDALVDETPRVLVLDGTPRLITHETTTPVGAPVLLTFDAPVRTAELAHDLFAYEQGGGFRALPVRLVSRGAGATEGQFLVAVQPTRSLEAGARIAIAVAPRWMSWGGSHPSVMEVELEPRPRIEGVGCTEYEWGGSDCSYDASPGAIIDIETDLTLRTTHALGEVPVSAVHITPPVSGIEVVVRGTGSEQRRHLAIHAEWDSNQVYEVRLGELFTERGERLVAIGPLAVRSAGHSPQVIAHTGTFPLEHDASLRWPFRAIHAEDGRVLRRSVAPGDEVRALAHPATYVLAAPEHTAPLAPLVPTSRPNRWGRGEIAIDHEGPRMEVVAIQPGTRSEPTDLTAALFVASDIGISATAVPGGVLVWATSIEHGTPIAFAHVAVGTFGYAIAEATTDASGAAYVPTSDGSHAPLEDAVAVVVTTSSDRSILALDARSAVGPSTLHVTDGEGVSEDGAVRATVITDRGAYRPQETLHAIAIVRRVEGATMTVPPQRAVVLRLMSPTSTVPVGTAAVPLSSAGVASTTFTLPEDAALGDYRIDVMLDSRVIGSATATVAEYREPRFRVDLDAPRDGTVNEGDPLHVAIHGRYLFGARLAGATARYSIVRGSVVRHGARWHDVSFAPVSAHAARSTLAEGSIDLDASGEAHIDGMVSLGIPTRTRLEVEVEVTDESGESTTAHRSIIARPAEVEVGVRHGDGWSALGHALAFEAIALDANDEPIVGAVMEARVIRESQQGYYEWEESDEDGGGFRLRHAEGTSVVHRCALRSASDFVRCAYTPDRAGSYVLEVEARDAHGRRSIASRRVYASGPDGAPDRDPPGSPVELTPGRERYEVGDDAEIAFESPFAGHALLSVETDRVLATQPIDLVPGGNRVHVRVTDAMVPNAFVSIVLVRPRTGPPPTGGGRTLDLDAPDLRIGAVELRASPHPEPLTVTIDAAAQALASSEVPIDVRVTNASGAAERGVEVALWAVDEGTLRVTDWSLPEATSGLFVRRAARFAIEDVRRSLVSRLPGALEPGPSGDGGFVDAVMQLASRERYEPTPLFQTSLVTDASGRAHANVTLPDRVTEYRLVAVAVGGAQRFGQAESSLVATRPLVVRLALPRFLTEGDEVELAAFVHDEAASAIDATVIVRAFGEDHALGVVHIEPGTDVRVATRVTVPIGAAPTPIEIVARSSNGDEHSVARTLDVMPRGRWVRERAMVMGATGTRTLAISFPAGTSQRGAMRAVVSLHPFIAADGLADDLANVWFGGGEIDAAVVLGLASHTRLGGTLVLRDSESEARAGTIRTRLRALGRNTTDSGGYSMGGTWATADARLTAATIRARIAAHDAGMLPREGPAWEATERAADALHELVRSGQVGASYGYGAGDRDLLALCLHVLALADRRDDATFTREFDGRDLLSPYALAHLAMAAADGDRRRDALVVLALGRFHRDHGPRFESADTSTLAALLVAAASTPAGHGSISAITSVLLDRSADGRESLGNPFATAEVIDAFARVAERFVVEDASPPTLALDTTALRSSEASGVSARFMMPFADVVSSGAHSIVARGTESRPVYMALEARWAEPLTSADDDGRGRALTLHRVVETPAGAAIPSGSHVALGSLVRVRLYIHTERSTPEWTAVRDPHPAGFEPVETGLESTPRNEIASLVGMGPDDEAIDVRARRALNSVDYIRSHEHAPHASTYQLRTLGPGLYELTYALRASTPGTFVAPPASLEALRDLDFVARSSAMSLTVDP